jgi:vacuolar-type H+-ATPase subunit H
MVFWLAVSIGCAESTVFEEKVCKTFRNQTINLCCGRMEKIWGELKKIEAQAECINVEARNSAKKLTDRARQESEKLVTNSRTYAEEESQQVYGSIVQEANRNRGEQMKTNQEAIEKLRAQAKKRVDQASSVIVSAVLGETKL